MVYVDDAPPIRTRSGRPITASIPELHGTAERYRPA